MQALWGEPWLGRRAPFPSMETKSCPFEEMSPISAYLPSNARWRGEGKARSREDEMAVPPRVLSGSTVLTRRIRFLALVVFSVLSCTFSKDCRKKPVDQRPPKSKAEILTPIVDFLCVKVLRRVKKDRTLVKKFRSSLSQRAAEHRCSGGGNKEQGSWTGIHSKGNHRHSKPKEGKVKVRDLRGILVRSSRAQIYIYKTVVSDRVLTLNRLYGYPSAVLRHASGPTGPRNSSRSLSAFIKSSLPGSSKSRCSRKQTKPSLSKINNSTCTLKMKLFFICIKRFFLAHFRGFVVGPSTFQNLAIHVSTVRCQYEESSCRFFFFSKVRKFFFLFLCKTIQRCEILNVCACVHERAHVCVCGIER